MHLHHGSPKSRGCSVLLLEFYINIPPFTSIICAYSQQTVILVFNSIVYLQE